MAKLTLIPLIELTVFICCINIWYGNAITVDSQAEIRNFLNELREDGSYKYSFDTTNGISQQESGVGGQYATGSSQFHTPDGQLIQLTYTADVNGFQAQGAHLPTPPPIPIAILKSLEYIRTHPYREDQHQQQQQLQPQPQRFQYQQQQAYTPTYRKFGK